MAFSKRISDETRPAFEFRAMGIGFDTTDHEGGEMAVLVREDIVEASVSGDDFRGEVD